MLIQIELDLTSFRHYICSLIQTHYVYSDIHYVYSDNICLFRQCSLRHFVYSDNMFIQTICLFRLSQYVYSGNVFIQTMCLFRHCIYLDIVFIQILHACC